MKGQELISVIIPVYKVEPYLPACLDSVLAQTYQNLDVILVDDGSPDNCGAICDEYAARDPRVRVIHQENSGASAARNTGLDAARGAYIGFVDPDDLIEPNMYQTLYERLQAAGAEVAQCGYALHEWEVVKIIFGSGENAVYDGAHGVEKLLTEGSPWWLVTDKLYRAELFQNLRFHEEIRVSEDVLLITRLFLSTRRLVFVKEPLYHWISRPASLSKFGLHNKDIVKSSLLVWREIEQKLPQLSGLGCWYFAKMTVYTFQKFLLNCGQYDRRACREVMSLARGELRRARPVILKTPEVGKTLKIKTCLITLAPGLYDFLFPIWLKTAKWRRKD